jgi:myo-inositol-1(or 4)-monophosphatase
MKSANLTIMVNAARKASKTLLRDFGEVENLQISEKGPGDFVTNADKRAEETIVAQLLGARPTWDILAEEGSDKSTNAEYRFVIDPLDGTTNFLHGFPYWAISIGLEKFDADGKAEIIAGVVMNPIMDEIYYAEKGQGAFLNDRRIRVSGRKDLKNAFIGCGSASSFRRPHKAPFDIRDALHRLGHSVNSVRCMNAAALDLAFVASGRYDGMVDLALKKWDCAAGIILVREAGGKVTKPHDFSEGYDDGDILASNFHLHEKLMRILSETKEL